VGLGGKFSWGDGVADALDKCSKSSDEGWIVVLVRIMIEWVNYLTTDCNTRKYHQVIQRQ
jgi:hypothetical protein